MRQRETLVQSAVAGRNGRVADENVRRPDEADGWLDGKRGVARGIAVALGRGGATARRKETLVLQKKMFKLGW